MNVHWSSLNPSAKRPHVSTGGNVPYSPYIVRLTKEGGKEGWEQTGYAAREEAPLVELVVDGGACVLRSEEERALLEQLLPEEDDCIAPYVPLAVAEAGQEDMVLQVADVPATEEVQLQRLAEALALLDQHQEAVVSPAAHTPHTVLHFGAHNPTQSLSEKNTLPFRHPLRIAASLSAMALVVTAPLHAAQLASQGASAAWKSEGAAWRGASYFSGALGAVQEGSMGAAAGDLTRALDAFRDAQTELRTISPVLTAAAHLIPQAGRAVVSVSALTEAGEHSAQAAATLAAGFEDFAKRGALAPSARLELLSTYFAAAEPDLQAAAMALAKVDITVVPAEYTEHVARAQRMLGAAAKSAQEFTAIAPVLQEILGAHRPVKYLVAFQNNTELRPTGGFIGSFAEVTIENGELQQVTVPAGGSYAVQGQMTARVAAPPPLQLLRAKWEFQDANWFPDFPMSARKLQWFYEKAGGPTTDGVIAINAAFLEELLGVTGPVTLQDGTEVNSENVLRVMRQDIDEKAANATTTTAPKAIVGELVGIILGQLKDASAEDFIALTRIVFTNLSDRDIQVYLAKNEAQRLVQQAGFDGGLKNAPDDYLMVVNTNLGGGKTDRIIEQQVNVQSTLLPDGGVENQVTITKKHHGLPGRGVEGVNNVDFLRLYVPEGATVVSVSGSEVPPSDVFESDNTLEVDNELAMHLEAYAVDQTTGAVTWREAGKSVIGAWMQTAPQEEQRLTIVYRVPASSFAGVRAQTENARRHTLFVQAPSGVHSRTTTVKMLPPGGQKVLYQTEEALTTSGVVTPAAADAFLGLVYEL